MSSRHPFAGGFHFRVRLHHLSLFLLPVLVVNSHDLISISFVVLAVTVSVSIRVQTQRSFTKMIKLPSVSFSSVT